MAEPAKRPQKPAAPAWRARRVLPGAEAAAEVFAPLAFGEAPRAGILGDSGTGKSQAARALVDEYLCRAPGVVLVIDNSDVISRFAGQERVDVEDLERYPPAPEPRVIVFRGQMDRKVDPESVARLAWDLGRRRRPSLTVYDELTDAADDGEWREGVTQIPAAFGQGRKHGIASLWGTQSPQDAPRTAFEQSSSILCFRLAGLGLNPLKRRGYLATATGETDVALIETLASFPGDEVAPSERGYFVLLRRGRAWNGHVYRFEI